MAPSRCATAETSSAGTNRNCASSSMKRLISHGQAIRSTLAFFRVTHFILDLLSSSIWQSPYVTRRPERRQLGQAAETAAGFNQLDPAHPVGPIDVRHHQS